MDLLKGLISAEVEESRKLHGENKLPEKKLKTAWDFFKETFKSGINIILLSMLAVFVFLAIIREVTITEPLGINITFLSKLSSSWLLAFTYLPAI